MAADWRTDPWRWGGDPQAPIAPNIREADRRWYRHAVHIPGVGWFGGFPPEIAEHLATCVNAGPSYERGERQAEQSLRDLPREGLE